MRTTFVGREAERAVLAERFRATRDGDGQVVLVAGEPGVGKTRLAEEIVATATGLGVATAVGRATDDEGSPPYWPVLRVFRALGLVPPPELDPRGAGGPASPQERFRLFETVTDALVTAADPGGLLVVLDDIQWADAASLRLLVHLAAAVPSTRLMVLATYRDTEIAGYEALTAAVAALAREPAVTRIRLAGLSDSEVATHLAAVTGWEVPEPVAVAVSRRTQGNPFFVGELGRLLISSVDGDLPDGIRDAVRVRIARLSPPCRSLVAAAAVLGSDVDPAALAHCTVRDLDDVLSSVDEAGRAGIVVGAARFTHDLIREAARLDVPTAERLALHGRMADYLTGRADADTRVGEIAFHRLESLPAGDAALAIAWAERAADRAMTQLAWEEAASLYGRALAVGTAEPQRRCELLLARARAQVNGFELQDGRRSLLTAVEIARALGDTETIARAVLTMEGFSDFLWDRTGRALCEEALAGLPDVDSPLRARLLALGVVSGSWQLRPDAGKRSAEALAMAERVGDPRALREALRARQMALSGPEHAADRLALGGRMLAVDDGDAVIWGHLWRFDALAQLGDVDGAEAELTPISEVAERLRSPLAGWHLARCRAAIAAARGHFASALGYARQAEAAARRADTEGPLLPSLGLLVILRTLTGDADAVPDDLLRAHFGSPATASMRAVYAMWRLLTGDREGAYQLYRGLPPPATLPAFVRLPAVGAMVDLAAEFEDPDTAAAAYPLLLPHADLFICGGAGVIMLGGSVRHSLGVAAALMGRVDDAVSHLRAALERNTRAGMPPAAAATAYQLAKVLARRRRPGDRDEAAGLVRQAIAISDGLGMKPLLRHAQALADILAGHEPGPLTPRERQIATLVSQGLTNRQIAGAAHISERTVESHVRNILDKLGFTSRSQIAVWAASTG